MTLRQLGALTLLAAIWGASFLFIRVAAPLLGPFPLMWARVAIAALALWAMFAARKRTITWRPYWRRLLVLGLAHAALPFVLIAAAEIRITASMAALLIATQPLFAGLIGSLVFGERISRRRAIGFALGLAGVGVLTGWSPVTLDLRTGLAIAATLLAALSYAVGGIYAKRQLSDAPVPALALGQQVAAGAWLLVPALWTSPQASVTTPAIMALLGLGLLSTAVAYLLFFWLIAEVGPVRAFTVTYLIPVFGVGWGRLVLHEPISPGILAGLACILSGLVLVNGMTPRLRLRKPDRNLPRYQAGAAGRG